jgi:hypothetical protein
MLTMNAGTSMHCPLVNRLDNTDGIVYRLNPDAFRVWCNACQATSLRRTPFISVSRV